MSIPRIRGRSPGPWVWLALVVVIAAIPLFLSSGAAGPSIFSRGPDGWVAANAYLTAQGVEVTLLDAPPAEDLDGSLVTAFPWQSPGLSNRADPLRRFARRGGILAVGYSGAAPGVAETTLFETLGCTIVEVRPPLPLAPVSWWRYRHESWELEPVNEARGPASRPATMRAPQFAPTPPSTATVHYRASPRSANAKSTPIPLVFSFPLGQGRVLVLPANAIANGGLARAGNVDLLENLHRWLGDSWTIDEAAHGLQALSVEGASSGGLTFDLFALHLLLLYCLAVLALARRFGPPWREPVVRTGSARSFLLGLGSLHHRLGHHRDGARRLLSRVQDLEPGLDLEGELEGASATDGTSLVRLARRVAALRRGEPLEYE